MGNIYLHVLHLYISKRNFSIFKLQFVVENVSMYVQVVWVLRPVCGGKTLKNTENMHYCINKMNQLNTIYTFSHV